MTNFGDILTHLRTGARIPDELLGELEVEDRAALRSLEQSVATNRAWRAMSMQLLDVAQQLTQAQASSKVFSNIVREARAVIGADIGYISLNDSETGRTNVLATSGVVTEAFRTIQMPIGSGILGIVAATNKPAWTYDHAADPEVTHVDYVDEAVRSEGIHGILGVPIQRAGETIGALLVGDRQPRRFSRDEVTALSLLGSITSVALETAQVIDAQHEAVEELTRTQETLEDHVGQLRKVTDSDSALLTLLSGKPSFDSLASFVSEHVDSPTALWLESSSSLFTADSLSASQRAQLAEGSGAALEVLPVEISGRRLGSIRVLGPLSAAEKRIIAHATAAFTAIALFNEALTAATSRKVDDLVYAAAIGTIGPQEITRLRQLTGLDLTSEQPLYFVGVSDPGGALSRARVGELIDGSSAVTMHGDHYCVLVQPRGSLAAALGGVLRSEEKIFASAVQVVGVDAAREAHDMAMDYLDAAVALGLANEVVTEDTMGSIGLILGSNPRSIELLTNRAVATLGEYDAAHATELEATAYQFFLHGHSVPATAKAMFVHANTVRQRLERITALLGEGWDRGPRSLDIHMGLHIRAMGRQA